MSTGSLDGFATELAARIGRPARVRPFVCDGSPLECRAIIVGSHPATALEIDFWEFWEPGTGFRRADWDTRYREARKHLGKTEVSPTRRILDRITAAAGPMRCLETNVEPTPGGTGPHVLDFLLASIRPAAVLAFGAAARRHFAELCGVDSAPNDGFHTVNTPWGTARLGMVSHLQGCSYARADELGRELARASGG